MLNNKYVHFVHHTELYIISKMTWENFAEGDVLELIKFAKAQELKTLAIEGADVGFEDSDDRLFQSLGFISTTTCAAGRKIWRISL